MRLEKLDPRPLNDPVKAARAGGLRYVSDEHPGITRERNGTGFRYRDPRRKFIHDRAVLSRIKALAVPPAWREVWICTDANGHLQATGRDKRARKQHRYHRRWREVRDETKYTRMIAFARALPKIRRRVDRDLRFRGLPRNKVLATVVRLLEVSAIRIGNPEYARENASFGLTTMRNRHVDVKGAALRFHFRGKAGKWHEINIHDRRLAKIVRCCQELPGQELFQYIDEEGRCQNVKSGDVNDYLREITGKDFTAKDFRTWCGTVLGARHLQEVDRVASQIEAKKQLAAAIEEVADRLGNTPAVCRRCYMHPEVINAYLEGTLSAALKRCAEQGNGVSRGLRAEEAVLLLFLQQRLQKNREPERGLAGLLRKSLAGAKKGSRDR